VASIHNQKKHIPFIIIMVCSFMLSGCSTDHYKNDADEEVYRILDQKWQGEFGPQTNFKVNDTLSSPNDIKIVELIPPSGKITLAHAIALATLRNRRYQTEKEKLYIQALDLTWARHRFAPQFFGIFGGNYHNEESGETANLDGSLGFDQLLADGTQISANIAADWMRFLTGDPGTSLSSVLSASVTKPLLRGRGRKIVQENLTQAERDTVYQLRDFHRFRKSFVVSIVTEYYRVLQALDRVENDYNNYENLKISEKRARMMAQADRMPLFEVGQNQQRTLQAHENYNSSQQSYEQRLDRFKISLSLPTDVEIELDPNELKSLERMGISNPRFDLNEAMATAVNTRLDLAIIKDQLDDAARRTAVAADNLGMDLNLIGSSRVPSRANTEIAQWEFHRGDYLLGFEADLPLDRKAERNAYRESLIGHMQAQRNYEEKVDEVKFDVRQAYRILQERSSSYRIQVNSLALAEDRVKSFEELLRLGRSSMRDLLEARADLLIAQNAKTRALIEHTIAKLNFYRDIGILQVRPDGLWQEPIQILSDHTSPKQQMGKGTKQKETEKKSIGS